MAETIFSYLADDHRRLEDALERAVNNGGAIEPNAYWEFRGGLLRHIGMEEKILLPAAKTARGGQALPLASKLHLDHGALAALLVLPPTHAIIAAIRVILAAHNPLEEGPEGVYAQCEQLVGADAASLLARLRAAPAVAMAEYVDNEISTGSARISLQRAGYDLSF